ncbi:MAG: asparagine synthase-related protein [Candidatus Acidiferrum sp.]
MSGIVGMFHRDGAPVDLALLRTLTEFMSYRGPDADVVWQDGAVGLGHALLQTTPESRDEKQPASPDGRLWLTADARLDERAELVAQLCGFGREIDSAPDSELILRSYDRWGENCVDHLRGDFAFAIWDSRAKRLFCARDHFGIKPLYYAQLVNLFLFSNTLNCLRAHPDVSGELNDRAVADFLLFGLNYDEASTSFHDIQRLPPAHCLTVSRDGLAMRRYWAPPTNGRIRYRSDEEYIEHFWTLLQAAVRDRLRTDRVGILLSGGLDSTSLAATAKDLSANNRGIPDLRTYTAVYESLIPDREIDYAAAVAKFLGLPNRRVALDHLRPFVWPDDPSCRLPGPPDNPFFGALFHQFGIVAKECRVLFSGEGNDNLMYFQMWPYVQELRRRKEWTRLAAEGLQYLWVRPFPWRGIRVRLAASFGMDSAADSFPAWIAPDFAKRLNLKDRWRECSELRMPVVRHPVRPKAHASLGLPHWTSMFENENAGVTRHPVDVRYPFLDLRLVNYLLALPPFPCFFQKSLLRRAMADKLPESVRIRPKTPFHGAPLLAHFRRDDISWVNRTPPQEELDRYINRGALPKLHASMLSEQVILGTRPHCLNFWLQSIRSPAEVNCVWRAGNG